LQEQVAVFIADGDPTAADVALVVGIERPGEAGRRGAGIGVRNANRLHWIRGFKGGYEINVEIIFILFWAQ
jgi:hypothetical protein